MTNKTKFTNILTNMTNVINDILIYKMLFSEIDVTKDQNTTENQLIINTRKEFIYEVIPYIFITRDTIKNLFTYFNNSKNTKYIQLFINGIIDFIVQNDLFNKPRGIKKIYIQNFILKLQILNNNIRNLFKNTIQELLNNNANQVNIEDKKNLNDLLSCFNNNNEIIIQNNYQEIKNELNNNKNNILIIINQEEQSIINEINNIKKSKHTNKTKYNNEITDDNKIKANYENEIKHESAANHENDMMIIDELNKQPNDFIQLIINNSVNDANTLVNFINNNKNIQEIKTVANSIIDFVIENKVLNEKSIYNKNFVNNFFLKLNKKALIVFRDLLKENHSDNITLCEHNNPYYDFYVRCHCGIELINSGNRDYNFVENKTIKTKTKRYNKKK